MPWGHAPGQVQITEGYQVTPNVTHRKFTAKVRVEESESENEEEFEDSREDIPPRDPIGPSSNQEQAPPPQSTLVHPGNQLGFGQDNQGGII